MGGIVGTGMLTSMIVGFVTKGAEIPFPKEGRQAGQGIVMAVFVQDPQALGTATISETRVGPIGVHHHQRVVGQEPGRTGAAHRRHTVPDGPRLSGGVPRLNAVGVGAHA